MWPDWPENVNQLHWLTWDLCGQIGLTSKWHVHYHVKLRTYNSINWHSLEKPRILWICDARLQILSEISILNTSNLRNQLGPNFHLGQECTDEVYEFHWPAWIDIFGSFYWKDAPGDGKRWRLKNHNQTNETNYQKQITPNDSCSSSFATLLHYRTLLNEGNP